MLSNRQTEPGSVTIVVKEATTIVQLRLEVEICPERVSVIVISHQTRKRHSYKNLGEEKGRDRQGTLRQEV